jgi:hypothetical protein
MSPTSHFGVWGYALLCATAFSLTAVPAKAQSVTSVPLVLQDFSDCQNGNVADPGGLLTKGTAWIVKNADGSLNIKVGITLVPDTTYHFFLKCVRQLGDITTGDEGTGIATFTVPPNTVGNVFAFDSYPEGAPAGNKMQSMTVRLP